MFRISLGISRRDRVCNEQVMKQQMEIDGSVTTDIARKQYGMAISDIQ